MLSININNKFSLTENQGVFKEFLKIVNFKGISSALENEIWIQAVFKEFKE